MVWVAPVPEPLPEPEPEPDPEPELEPPPQFADVGVPPHAAKDTAITTRHAINSGFCPDLIVNFSFICPRAIGARWGRSSHDQSAFQRTQFPRVRPSLQRLTEG